MANYNNIILMTDSYKNSMMNGQYEDGTEYVYSYIESRGGKWDNVLFFGLQIFLKEYLAKPITYADIAEAKTIWMAHMGQFDEDKWKYIVEKHDGYFPVSIKAVPEGCVVDGKNVLVTIVNTDPKCYWLTTYLETALLRSVWYPTTVASNSHACKKIIMDALEKSSDDPKGQIGFKLHDFSGRGNSSHESAGIASSAHLISFLGTDTIEAIPLIQRFYSTTDMVGFSISASEHSTVTSWGKDREVNFYKNMLKHHAKPGGLVAMVADSFDLFNAVDNIFGDAIKQDILNCGATVVCRPDSGNPETTPVEVVKRLGEKFGYTINSKGFKVLPSCIRVIQSDGIRYDTIIIILDNLLEAGWSADNLAFGMGAGLVDGNRDVMKFAMKCSAVCVNGEWRDVFKDPITDPGKRSKSGRFALIHEYGKWETVPFEGNQWRDELTEVFRGGEIVKEYTFAEVRERSNRG